MAKKGSSWWVVVFGLVCLLFYFQASQTKNKVYNEAALQLKSLENEKNIALATREELLLQLQSQSDPAWVEMVLKRNLGVVPEGQVKVYFQN